MLNFNYFAVEEAIDSDEIQSGLFRTDRMGLQYFWTRKTEGEDAPQLLTCAQLKSWTCLNNA
jgi:hypothetical protein